MAKHDFEPLSATHITLGDEEDEQLRHWLALAWLSCEERLWGETNFHALWQRLSDRAGDDKDKVRLVDDGCGDHVILCAPHEDDLLEAAALMIQHMDSGEHLDEGTFIDALKERVEEYWDELDWSDRVNMLQGTTIHLSQIFSPMCPDNLRVLLEEDIA